MNENIIRRIKFLLDAAKHEKTKDQVITYALRVLSNHATIGKDAGSATIKKTNKRLSKGAYEILCSSSLETYCSETINEHPKPIKQTWEWLRENAQSLTVEEIWREFCEHKMITVTKEEDERIRESGQNSSGDFESRYTSLGLQVVTLELTPAEFHKRLKVKPI